MKRINCGIVGIYEFQGDNKLGNAISIWFHSDKPWINKFFGAIATASHQSDPYALSHAHTLNWQWNAYGAGGKQIDSTHKYVVCSRYVELWIVPKN